MMAITAGSDDADSPTHAYILAGLFICQQASKSINESMNESINQSTPSVERQSSQFVRAA